MKSLSSSVLKIVKEQNVKFLKSLRSQLLRWGASKLRQMSQISKDMSAAAFPLAQSGPTVENGKRKKRTWMRDEGGARSLEFGMKMYILYHFWAAMFGLNMYISNPSQMLKIQVKSRIREKKRCNV